MAAVINALARLPQRQLPAQAASMLLAHTPRRAGDHAEVFALADVLANANQGTPANEDEIWMISYMDIMTVLLTLFVLLLAVAKTTPDALAPATSAGIAHKTLATPVAHVTALARKSPARASAVVRPRAIAVDPLAPAFGSHSFPCPPPCIPAVVSQGQKGPDWLNPLKVDSHVSVGPMRIAGDKDRHAPATNVTVATPITATAPTTTKTAVLTAAATASVTMDPAGTSTPKSAAILSARDRLLAKLRASPLGQRIETTIDQDNVSLEISDNVLFDTGSATLKARGRAVLDELAGLLRAQNYTVSIEGHSDNVSFHNAAFASNWELSATRATHVTRYLIAQGIAATRLRAVGYADTHPRADNHSAAGRARNRRVSLVLHLPLSTALPANQ